MTEQELAERKQREHLADLDLMRRLSLEMSTEEMERNFIEYVKATFFIDDLANAIGFEQLYKDFEHFKDEHNPNNFYERAFFEMLSKNKEYQELFRS